MSGAVTLEAIDLLRESRDVECKLAQGRDGKGSLPKDFWETYSAFANTDGGTVYLGIKEHKKDGRLEAVGISDPDKIRKQLFDLLNNSENVSANLLDDNAVSEISVEGKTVLEIQVPPASRSQRPVYLRGNYANSYRRQHEGDYRLPLQTINRMIADQQDARDGVVLRAYDLDDLSAETISLYRRRLRDRSPDHPALELEGTDFLRMIGAWGKNREEGGYGVTVAGLLMFGLHQSIQDHFPAYQPDYMERDDTNRTRWTDRVVWDGTWSGNIFDFYHKVFRKLSDGLPVPFELDRDMVRQAETPAHKALREALVNCLVHADYSVPGRLVVVKRPDLFAFMNPGRMLVTVEQASEGGHHEARNAKLHTMFSLVGLGERAGTGIPTIKKGWRASNWPAPVLYTQDNPWERTILELHVSDLVPDQVRAVLDELFGDALSGLSSDERMLLAAAHMEGQINHETARRYCDMHPVDLSTLLARLSGGGFLEKHGQKRGTVYTLPGHAGVTPDDIFADSGIGEKISDGSPNLKKSSPDLAKSSPDLDESSPDLDESFHDPATSSPDSVRQSQDNETSPQVAGEEEGANPTASSADSSGIIKGGRPIPGSKYRIYASLAEFDAQQKERMLEIAVLPRTKKALHSEQDKQELEKIILRLCEGKYLTLSVLSDIVSRSAEYLRSNYLRELTNSGKLKMAFPHRPNDPRQGYRSEAEVDPNDRG